MSWPHPARVAEPSGRAEPRSRQFAAPPWPMQPMQRRCRPTRCAFRVLARNANSEKAKKKKKVLLCENNSFAVLDPVTRVGVGEGSPPRSARDRIWGRGEDVRSGAVPGVTGRRS